MDFTHLKSWINEKYDHRYLNDVCGRAMSKFLAYRKVPSDRLREEAPGEPPPEVIERTYPGLTAELFCVELTDFVREKLSTDPLYKDRSLVLCEVAVWETPGCEVRSILAD